MTSLKEWSPNFLKPSQYFLSDQVETLQPFSCLKSLKILSREGSEYSEKASSLSRMKIYVITSFTSFLQFKGAYFRASSRESHPTYLGRGLWLLPVLLRLAFDTVMVIHNLLSSEAGLGGNHVELRRAGTEGRPA